MERCEHRTVHDFCQWSQLGKDIKCNLAHCRIMKEVKGENDSK